MKPNFVTFLFLKAFCLAILPGHGKGENPLPSLGSSTEAVEGSRFFISSSQPLSITQPPSLIEPTSSTVILSTSSSSVLVSPSDQVSFAAATTAQSSVILSSNSATKSLPELLPSSSDEEIAESSVAEELEETEDQKDEYPQTEGKAMTEKSPLLSDSSEQRSVVSSSEAPSTFGAKSVEEDEDKSISLTTGDEPHVSSLPEKNAGIITTSGSSGIISDYLDQPSTISPTAASEILEQTSNTNSPFFSETESFLADEVSMAAAASRPEELPRVAPSNLENNGDASLSVDEDSTIKIKKNRQSDSASSNPLPGMNDLLTGLLNVVGEGLTIATNFVKEENERKKEAASKSVKEKEASRLAAQLEAVSAVPAIFKPGRINNRGPPRISEVPFEAIPLEILNSQQRPGAAPIQFQQRPFQTRIKITKTKLQPPFASGIPLPEVLIPGFEMPITTTQESTSSEIPSLLDESSNAIREEVKQQETNAAEGNNENLIKLQNKYNPRPLLGLNGDDLELRPSKTTTTIMATASRPIWPPKTNRRPPFKRPGNIEATRRPQFTNTPPLRPFPKASTTEPSIVIKPIKDRDEVLFAGQAFDVKPITREPLPEVFDLVVTAEQNYGGASKKAPSVVVFPDDGIITKASPGGDQFVSIDGKRTYFEVGPTRLPFNGDNDNVPRDVSNSYPSQKGQAIGSSDDLLTSPSIGQLGPLTQPIVNRPSSNYVEKSVPKQRPEASPVRIDTCIVGDDSTCELEKHEVCLTSLGVSSCDCKPGYGRVNIRKSCKKTVRLMMSLQVDKLKQQIVRWNKNYLNPNSDEYRTMEDEAIYAIDTAIALTSLSNVYISSEVNRFFDLNGKVTVNATILLLENSYTSSVIIKRDVQRKLIEVIQARGNNIGNGNLFVDGNLNPIPGVADVDECSEPELNDCDPLTARCINRFGSFDCKCLPGYGDRFEQDPEKAGRFCESCSADICSGRGTCLIEDGDVKVCKCKGNYYGNRCEIDGEVVAVAVGASVAAVVIILLTLTCLCIWSRRWKREQRKAEIMRTFPSTYLNGPNPHLAATYMANMNKAAAYAAAVSRQHAITLNGQIPYGGAQQQPLAASQDELSPEARLRMQQGSTDLYGQNIYAQLHPIGNGSQFQPRDFYPPPPPAHPPPPIPPLLEPLYSYPSSSLYGTLPRGPPRPVERGSILDPIFDQPESVMEEDSNAITNTSAIMRKNELSRSQMINYATFRQNISAEAAAAAQKRAEMVTAQLARHWSNEDLRMPAKKSDNNYDDNNSSSSSSMGSQITEGDRVSSPSPLSRRSRSSSPGKTVTFLDVNDHQDDRSLDELDASPRRMMPFANLKAASSGLGFSLINRKKRAPSPPTNEDSLTSSSKGHDSGSSTGKIELSDEEDAEEDEDLTSAGRKHELLGAKLSASLRATFGLKHPPST